MVVAFVAVETNRQEQVGRIFHDQRGVAENLEVGGRRALDSGATGGENLTGRFIVRLIPGDHVLDPVAHGDGPLLAEEFPIDLKHVGPFVGPMLDIFRVSDQLIDQRGSLFPAGAWVYQEFSRGVNFGWQTSQVEIDTPQEFGIATNFRRQDLDALQLRIHVFVDVVVMFRFLPREPCTVAHGGQRGRRVGPLVTYQHRRFAPSQEREQATFVCFQNLDVATFDKGLSGDVSHTTILVCGQYGHLLAHAGPRQDRVLRQDFHRLHTRSVQIQFCAFRDPLTNHLVIRCARIGTHTAHMRNRSGGLQ